MVRISGAEAFPILARLIHIPLDRLPAARTQALVTIHDPDRERILDRALVCRYPGPASYTGEDVVEIACHGGQLTVQLVLAAALAAGARSALPGEFTRRAVLNGKMDFTQAEAVIDLIDASSPAMQQAALHQLDRGLGRRIDELRDAVLEVEALVSYGIDFPEEDEPPVAGSAIIERAEGAIDRIELLLATAAEGAMLKEGALVVLAGRPNAGKSSLFNALLGMERAIVTEIPGTTRDAVEADALLDGYPFRLVDTAGLRETEDHVEAIGIEVAGRYLRRAELILFCAEAEEALHPDDRRFLDDWSDRTATLLLRTKADRGDFAADGGLRVSVETGEGIGTLRQQMVELAFGGIRRQAQERPIVTSRRHSAALELAAAEMKRFVEATREGVPAEYASTHLRSAAESLEGIVGAITTEDMLGALFSRFCVGK